AAAARRKATGVNALRAWVNNLMHNPLTDANPRGTAPIDDALAEAEERAERERAELERAERVRAYVRRLPPVAQWFVEGVDAAGRPVDPRGAVLAGLLVDAEDAVVASERTLRTVAGHLAGATDEAKLKAATAALAAAREAHGLVVAARDRARAE